jgi:hypothetical protein
MQNVGRYANSNRLDLIAIERRGKRSPLVTLIVGNGFKGGTVASAIAPHRRTSV